MAAMVTADIAIRRVVSMNEIRAVSDVVEEVAGYRDVHPGVLLSVLETGGYVAGAFDARGECVGSLYGLLGLRKGIPFLHSEMLAVRPRARGGHVARALKLDQRAFALEVGLEPITWTYDPLRGVNANLNIRLLGCTVVGYEADKYGDLPGFSSGWPTDQLSLEWWPDSERVSQALAGAGPVYRPEELPPVVETFVRSDGLLVFDHVAESDEEVVRLEIPDSVQTMRGIDMHEVLKWRFGVREAFETYFSRGYEVDWFVSRTDARRRNFYILKKRGPVDDGE